MSDTIRIKAIVISTTGEDGLINNIPVPASLSITELRDYLEPRLIDHTFSPTNGTTITISKVLGVQLP